MSHARADFASPAFHLLCTFALAANLVLATTSTAAPVAVEAITEIGFTGSSSLHDWTGKAATVHSPLRASSVAGQWDGDLTIPVAGLDSGNGSRDERMREMFHADRSPTIAVALRGIDPDAVQRAGGLVAKLTIDNTTRDIRTMVSNWKQQEKGFSFDADTTVSLKEFGLEAPSVLGLVRVADDVKIHAHVVLIVTDGAAPTAGPAK